MNQSSDVPVLNDACKFASNRNCSNVHLTNRVALWQALNLFFDLQVASGNLMLCVVGIFVMDLAQVIGLFLDSVLAFSIIQGGESLLHSSYVKTR